MRRRREEGGGRTKKKLVVVVVVVVGGRCGGGGGGGSLRHGTVVVAMTVIALSRSSVGDSLGKEERNIRVARGGGRRESRRSRHRSKRDLSFRKEPIVAAERVSANRKLRTGCACHTHLNTYQVMYVICMCRRQQHVELRR